jgi:hypothetical protein
MRLCRALSKPPHFRNSTPYSGYPLGLRSSHSSVFSYALLGWFQLSSVEYLFLVPLEDHDVTVKDGYATIIRLTGFD